MDRIEVELREIPAVTANDTSTGSGEPSLAVDSSAGAFLASWNTSAGVRSPQDLADGDAAALGVGVCVGVGPVGCPLPGPGPCRWLTWVMRPTSPMLRCTITPKHQFPVSRQDAPGVAGAHTRQRGCLVQYNMLSEQTIQTAR